jgi:hypothetical protein
MSRTCTPRSTLYALRSWIRSFRGRHSLTAHTLAPLCACDQTTTEKVPINLHLRETLAHGTETNDDLSKIPLSRTQPVHPYYELQYHISRFSQWPRHPRCLDSFLIFEMLEQARVRITVTFMPPLYLLQSSSQVHSPSLRSTSPSYLSQPINLKKPSPVSMVTTPQCPAVFVTGGRLTRLSTFTLNIHLVRGAWKTSSIQVRHPCLSGLLERIFNEETRRKECPKRVTLMHIEPRMKWP